MKYLVQFKIHFLKFETFDFNISLTKLELNFGIGFDFGSTHKGQHLHVKF